MVFFNEVNLDDRDLLRSLIDFYVHSKGCNHVEYEGSSLTCLRFFFFENQAELVFELMTDKPWPFKVNVTNCNTQKKIYGSPNSWMHHNTDFYIDIFIGTDELYFKQFIDIYSDCMRTKVEPKSQDVPRAKGSIWGYDSAEALEIGIKYSSDCYMIGECQLSLEFDVSKSYRAIEAMAVFSHLDFPFDVNDFMEEAKRRVRVEFVADDDVWELLNNYNIG